MKIGLRNFFLNFIVNSAHALIGSRACCLAGGERVSGSARVPRVNVELPDEILSALRELFGADIDAEIHALFAD